MVSKVETNPVDFDDWVGLHRMLHTAFAYMAPLIDPPSSLLTMGPDDLAAKSDSEDLFLIREKGELRACLFGVARGDVYYVGKIAAAPQHQGKGLARRLVEAAAAHAAARGFAALELQSRVELTGNHAAFARMGFQQTGSFTHPGFDRPTSLTFRRALPRV